MSSDYQLEDTVYLPFTTRAFATGIPTALVSGVVEIYEDASVTQITGAETLTVSLDSVAGFNMIAVVATAANGFEAGKSYTAILSAGTVDSVSVIGEVVGHFTLDMSAAAKDLANATDGLGALKALLPTALVGGRMDANVGAINGSVAAAVRHALAAGQMVPGTVDNTAHTPTTTEFEADDITEATADHFGGLTNNGRLVLWTTGALAGQVAPVTDYALTSGRGHFTVETMTEAAANDDTFILI